MFTIERNRINTLTISAIIRWTAHQTPLRINWISLTTNPEHHSKIQPEIQFLRALAVLLVILSHSKFSMWSGGFVGVDMFFVVSGYVICLSLKHERKNKNKWVFVKIMCQSEHLLCCQTMWCFSAFYIETWVQMVHMIIIDKTNPTFHKLYRIFGKARFVLR